MRSIFLCSEKQTKECRRHFIVIEPYGPANRRKAHSIFEKKTTRKHQKIFRKRSENYIWIRIFKHFIANVPKILCVDTLGSRKHETTYLNRDLKKFLIKKYFPQSVSTFLMNLYHASLLHDHVKYGVLDY